MRQYFTDKLKDKVEAQKMVKIDSTISDNRKRIKSVSRKVLDMDQIMERCKTEFGVRILKENPDDLKL